MLKISLRPIRTAKGIYSLRDSVGSVFGQVSKGGGKLWLLKLNGYRWDCGNPCLRAGLTTKALRSLEQARLYAEDVLNGVVPIKGQPNLKLRHGASNVEGEVLRASELLAHPAQPGDVVQKIVLAGGCQPKPVTPADIDKAIIDGEFRKAWAQKEAEGFRYGHDALEQVRMGFAMGMKHIAQQDAKLPPVAVAPSLATLYPHYHKDVHHLKSIDVYRVLLLWDVTDPCLQHAIKKLLAAGQRGAKDVRKDVREAMVSCQRFLEMRVEDDTL